MKINTNHIQETLSKLSSTQPTPEKTARDNNTDASLIVDYASLIEQAIQADQTDPKAVLQARQLLESGQLDTPENIRQAAKNIADIGL